ncbi:DASH family cryptochrome [Halomonas organivorans]|uniref:Cryptochrome DASH n=1 Tax=Halomonas organivorans TaxID=257772 RepID=A0A7W5C1C9_9GAMM|nr:DASH family cryptochrome [Halomonas organivorans]MBB3142979.1 deoxyribodipyrimidine photo-lyase [Halomonas organivorans]
MSVDLVWLRQDLRLADNPLFGGPLDEHLLCVYVLDERWLADGRLGSARLGFLWQCLIELRGCLLAQGSDLLVRLGDPADEVAKLVASEGAGRVRVRHDPGWEEVRAVDRLRHRLANECRVEVLESGMLFSSASLPLAIEALPAGFSAFRRKMREMVPQRGIPAPVTLPPWPPSAPRGLPALRRVCPRADRWRASPRGGFRFTGGEAAGRARLDDYLWGSGAVSHYAHTRNGLVGADFSSRLSPWLAHGCVSAAQVNDALHAWETEHGDSESSRWLRFELLWREYFHWAARQDGRTLYGRETAPLGGDAFAAWCRGETGLPFVDAGMRELADTGWLSNRARQNVASFLVHDLNVDWRLGAAWFERCLIDYDAASNWGNWGYIAGRGRHVRAHRFEVLDQAECYDPHGDYAVRWCPELSSLPAGEARHRPWRHAPATFPPPLAPSTR